MAENTETNETPADPEPQKKPTSDDTSGGENETSKDANNASGSTDGFIGSRRIRTFLIGGLLCAWGILGGIGLFGLVKGFGFYGFMNVVTGIAAFVLVGGCAAAIVLHCLGKDGGIETYVGYAVLITGIVICVAQVIGSFASKAGRIYFFKIIGEGILPGGTAIFLGLDIVQDFMSKEDRRLFCNLALLATTACMCMMAYYDSSKGVPAACKLLKDFGASRKGLGCGGWGAVGTGYLIIAATSITYCVLNFCSCITCGCDKNPMIRLIIAGFLIVGGVVTAIGYWVVSNAISVSLGIGLSVLVGGLCVTWALDMGIVDDVKGMKK